LNWHRRPRAACRLHFCLCHHRTDRSYCLKNR
jgi:hypothetical protein